VNIFDLQNEPVLIENYQSTFLILKHEHKIYRFDLIDKKEFSLKKGTSGQLSYFHEHPLLIDHNENVIMTYINSKPIFLESFVEDIKSAIDKICHGWRDWTNYVTDKRINFSYETFIENVNSGSGRLLEAPYSITQDVIDVCKKHNVATKTFNNELQKYDYKLVTIGNNFVIAKEFRFSDL